VWRPIDFLARWLADVLGAQNQLRLGILCVLASIPLAIYGFWSNEQFVIYEMSALALTLAGAGIVVGAQVLLRQENERVDG
jgi:hypothetical protein